MVDKKTSALDDGDSLTIEELSSFCKRKGFVFPSSEIYGGMSGFWDYGPLGVELFNNLKREWWNFFVRSRDDMVGIDASIISHPKTWEASGHVANFGDLLLSCSSMKCGNRVRADHFIEEQLKINADGLKADQINKLVQKHGLKCPKCKSPFEELKAFNLLFKTVVGAKEDSSATAYLRGETAQGMFLNFKNIVDSSRVKLPFGIAQIGRCFRNEIAPRDFLFRSREFHIAEFEFFIHPDEKKCPLLDSRHLNVEFQILDAETQNAEKKDLKKVMMKDLLTKRKLDEWHAYWLAEQLFFFEELGLDMHKVKVREHVKTELSHYSSATFDIDYQFSFGSKEIAGNANRGQYDLQQHVQFSKQKLELFDEASKQNVIPRVIEPTFGVERVFLAILDSSYENSKERENTILHLSPKLAPFQIAVLPLVKREEFEKLGEEIVSDLRKEFSVTYDKTASIGRRYSRNDEIGTAYCITIDEEAVSNKRVTIRDRDSGKQIRVDVDNLRDTIRKLVFGEIKFLNAGVIV